MVKLRKRVFPGPGILWVGALCGVAISSLLLGRQLLARTASLTGTNSVDVATTVASAKSSVEVCVRDLQVPAATGRIAVSLAVTASRPGAALDAVLEADGKRRSLSVEGAPGALSFVNFALDRPLPSEVRNAAVCLTPHRMALAFGGAFVQRLPHSPVTTVGRSAIGQGDVSVKYLVASGPTPRVASRLLPALKRAALFDSWLGTALVWLAIPALLALVYAVVRVAATSDSYSLRRLATFAFVIAFVHASAWAVLLHPLHGADESEHFAYAQYLASTNHRPDTAMGSSRSAYSSSELRLMEVLHHNSTVLNPSSRVRWDPYWESKYVRARRGAAENDGGGYTESASGHSPLYYAFVGIPYRIFAGANLPSVLLAMRLFSALLAAAVAAITVLVANSVFRGNKQTAWIAGILVALQPVFGSVAGSVNNDTAVNFFAALLIYVLVRTWDAGPTRGLAIAAGLCAVALPVAKITGFALMPVVGVSAVLFIGRFGIRRAGEWAAVSVGSALATVAAWLFVLSPLFAGERGAIVNTHPAIAAAGSAAPAAAPITLWDRATYFGQTFVPHLPLGRQHWALPATGDRFDTWPAYVIYIRRGYGLFGWKSVELSPNLLHLVLLALVGGWVLALVAAVRHRRRWREWLGGVIILAASLMAVLAFISYAYSSDNVRADAGEQGRYVFTALVPLGVGLAAATLAFRGRIQRLLIGTVAGSGGCLALLTWVSALRGWFI
jgi:4-amino-4-deoxy-L-arabinose transferase-like glycosyltransferase